MYVQVYFTLIDTAMAALNSRFSQESFAVVRGLEEVLLSGNLNSHESLVQAYPEIDNSRLRLQLPMFRSNFEYSCLLEAVEVIQSAPSEVRTLFAEVEKLVRCLLVVPASSCEAERSFSGLRRLKTYLRSTMSQSRLNSVAVCHVHQQRLDDIDLDDICKTFVSLNDDRQRLFGVQARI